MASKIVVIGNVNGSVRDAFAKLAKLQTKQNFSFAIVIGDLFGDNSSDSDAEEITALLQGSINISLPTYFTVGNHMIPKRIVEKLESDDEVCPNLYFLGRRGTLKTSEGIRIVALGGNLESVATSQGDMNVKYLPRYTDSDARSLYGAHTADILLTTQWPKSIHTGSKVALSDPANIPDGVQCIADLCSILRPRYHFSSCADIFFEREPFYHIPTGDDHEAKHITRFINLASFSKSSGQKWLYAFNLDPSTSRPATLPAGTTASPLASVAKKRQALQGQQETFSRFSQHEDYQRFSKRVRRPHPGPGECFFCLSNPSIATHLITSIGTDCYLTTAKGPMSTSKTFPSLGFPGHILIVPLIHAPTFDAMSDTASRSSTYDEMKRYRSSLHAMVHEKSGGELGGVTWEVSRGGGIHIHWQFLPVLSSMVSRGLVEAAFKVEAENLNYPKFERRTEEDEIAEKGDYFRVWIWGTSEDTSDRKHRPGGVGKDAAEITIVLPLSPNFRFDLQFGRRVMAKLLELESRMNWRDIVQSQEEEKADADAFRKAFEKFDFSLEEG